MSDKADAAVKRARRVAGALAVLGVTALLVAPKPWNVPGGPGFWATDRDLGDSVRIALWWAAALNTLLAGVLAASASRWAAPLPSAAVERERAPSFRAFAPLLLLAAVLAIGVRWPLAGTSIWPDEAWSVEHTIAGMTKPERRNPDRLRTHIVTWQETLFDYERPTNHVLYSAAARTSNEIWRRAAGREAPAFSARAIRLPALLAAALAIPLLGLLLRDWGFPRSGVAAAFVLALHPWHALHGAEARGYAFVLLFAVCACLALGRALAGGSGRAWAGYAVSLVALVWSHLFGVFLAVALAGAALAGAWIGGDAGARGARTTRALVAHLGAAMLLIQLMAPNIAQVPGWREHFVGRSATQLSVAAIGHLWSFAATGLEARHKGAPPERHEDMYPSLAEAGADRPWVPALALGLLPLLAALGGVRVVRRRGPPAWVAGALAASIPFAIAATQLQGGQWYPRFAFWILIPVIGFACIGVEIAAERLPWPDIRWRRWGVPAVLAAAVAGWLSLSAPQTRLVLTRPQLPSAESVALARKVAGDDGIVAVLGLRGGNMHFLLYDPRLREVENASDLESLLREASTRGVGLAVLYAYAYKNRDVRADAFRHLDDPTRFEEAGVLHAVLDDRMTRILRWTGRPLAEDGA